MDNKDNKRYEEELQHDDFTGLDDGLAGSSEDSYHGDYTIQPEKINGRTVNKRVGIYTPKTEADKEKEWPTLDEKLAEAEKRFEAQFSKNDQQTQVKNKDDLEP